MKPTFFQLGALEIHSYGTMIALGVLAALFLMLRHARRNGFPEIHVVYDSVFVVLLTGFLMLVFIWTTHYLSAYIYLENIYVNGEYEKRQACSLRSIKYGFDQSESF